MHYSFGCELAFKVAAPTVFIFSIEAAQIPAHGGLREKLVVEPNVEWHSYTVPPFANRYMRINAPPGELRVRYSGSVDLAARQADPSGIAEIPITKLPLEVFSYLQPSRYCESDRLQKFAADTFGAMPPGFARVTAICNWINDNIEYRSGASNAQTSAAQTLEQCAGVCRDFAHLGIAICRALDIPARFVSCYALGLTPADFHAVFEAYLGGSWWLFDATRQAALDGLVRIGIGRDAAEVSFASVFGNAELTAMRVNIAAGDPHAEGRERTVGAVSTT